MPACRHRPEEAALVRLGAPPGRGNDLMNH